MTKHPVVHVIAGCAVAGTGCDEREIVERVIVGETPVFWGHYRVAEDGRQLWLADYDGRELAIAAAKAQAGGRPIYVEDNGMLTVLSTKAMPTRST